MTTTATTTSTATTKWVSQRLASDHTGISERTLTRLRIGSTDKGVHTPPDLTPGKHWRRISAAPKGRVQYNLVTLDQALNELSARGPAGLEVA